jgi:hypothetical protein
VPVGLLLPPVCSSRIYRRAWKLSLCGKSVLRGTKVSDLKTSPEIFGKVRAKAEPSRPQQAIITSITEIETLGMESGMKMQWNRRWLVR